MADTGAVYLMVFHQRSAGTSANGTLKAVEIFNDPLGSVTPVGPQIQRVKRGEGDSAHTGGKAVVGALPLGGVAGEKSNAAAPDTTKVDGKFLLELGNGNTLFILP